MQKRPRIAPNRQPPAETNSLAKAAPKETPKETPKERSKDSSKEPSKKSSKKSPRDPPPKPPKDTPKETPKETPKGSSTDEEYPNEQPSEEEDDYPHHSARKGSRYQTPVGDFDPRVRATYKPSRQPPELVWDPTRLSTEQLNDFVALFPADVLEDVYVVIQQKNYDLKQAYEEVGRGEAGLTVAYSEPAAESHLTVQSGGRAAVRGQHR